MVPTGLNMLGLGPVWDWFVYISSGPNEISAQYYKMLQWHIHPMLWNVTMRFPCNIDNFMIQNELGNFMILNEFAILTISW